jgi:uncharacterized membrane protein
MTLRRNLLIGLLLLGAMANLAGPREPWFGVDIGATGASLLYLACILLAVQLGLDDGALFAPEISYAERHAWVASFFVALVLVQLAKSGWPLAAYDAAPEVVWRHLWPKLLVMFAAWIGISIVLRARHRDAVTLDERDLRIHHRAERFSSVALAILMISTVVLLAVHREQIAEWLDPILLAHFLIGLLVTKLLVENVCAVVLYRRARQ